MIGFVVAPPGLRIDWAAVNKLRDCFSPVCLCSTDKKILDASAKFGLTKLRYKNDNELLLLTVATAEKSNQQSLALVSANYPLLDRAVICHAIKTFEETDADSLISLDPEGEEIDAIQIFKTSYLLSNNFDFSKDKRRCIPYGLSPKNSLPTQKLKKYGGLKGIRATEQLKYFKKRHVALAEKYRDKIKDRLLSPERVPEEYKKLIPDDYKRVRIILGLPYGERVLDAGCSDGTISIKIAELGKRVVGIDIAPSAIKEANEQRESCPKEIRRNVSFQVGTVEDLDFPDNYFYTVCAFETLEHLGASQVDAGIKSLVRVLKPRGNLLVTTPNRYPNASYVKEGRSRWKWHNHFHFFSKLSLECILSKYFKEIRFAAMNEKPEEGIYLICECRGKKPCKEPK